MSLNSDVAAQFPDDAIAIYGETVVYHITATAVDTSIQAVPLRQTRRRAYDVSETVEAEVMDFLVRASDIAVPADSYLAQAKDYLTFESVKWYVINLAQRNVGGLHQIHCATKDFRFL